MQLLVYKIHILEKNAYLNATNDQLPTKKEHLHNRITFRKSWDQKLRIHFVLPKFLVLAGSALWCRHTSRPWSHAFPRGLYWYLWQFRINQSAEQKIGIFDWPKTFFVSVYYQYQWKIHVSVLMRPLKVRVVCVQYMYMKVNFIFIILHMV